MYSTSLNRKPWPRSKAKQFEHRKQKRERYGNYFIASIATAFDDPLAEAHAASMDFYRTDPRRVSACHNTERKS